MVVEGEVMFIETVLFAMKCIAGVLIGSVMFKTLSTVSTFQINQSYKVIIKVNQSWSAVNKQVLASIYFEYMGVPTEDLNCKL